jgi:hypothetical protein
VGVRRAKAALSSGCNSHPATFGRIFTAWSRSVPVGLSPAGSTTRVKPFSRSQSAVTVASGRRLG